jgi:hypothetical protein
LNIRILVASAPEIADDRGPQISIRLYLPIPHPPSYRFLLMLLRPAVANSIRDHNKIRSLDFVQYFGGCRARNASWLALIFGIFLLGPRVPVQGQTESPDSHFEKAVVPLLISRCLECHNASEQSGGLSLESFAELVQGGDSGSAIDSNDATKSLLWERVSSGEMPPPRQGLSQELPVEEKEILKEWLSTGAPWPQDRKLDLFERTTKTRGGRDWWSLQPIRPTSIPALSQTTSDSASNYIDAFILHSLAEKSWLPAPRSEKELLLRRLYWDLTGLSPTLDEIKSFIADDAPDAYERRVDKLLASPQFGVRWGRYWLDLVRYADTSGYERDQEKAFAWKYRDWVVQAWNADLPYDQFVRWQVAGDEEPSTSNKTDRDEIVATGFLRLGTWNDEPNDPADYVYERLEDMVHVTSSAFIGLTVKCARCHDHKFDPISQADYYRIGSAFWSGPIANRNSKWLGGPSPEELPGDVLGWTDIASTPSPLHRLKKGETNHPLDVIAPAAPSFLPALHHPFTAPSATSATSTRRSQLADWLLEPNQPLTSRVIVNRLWQYHFGNGLVRSPNNWGFTGELPTHPQLLDHLALRLQQSAWSLKKLHRDMLLSSTYQQSAVHPQHQVYSASDASNRLQWHSNLRRTDAESLRDRLLQAAGILDLRLSGPGFRPPLPRDVLDGLSMKSRAWVPSPTTDQVRRSLYLYAQRSLAVPLMNTFDACDTAQACAQREVTTVAPQALALMNNAMIVQPCEALAERLLQSTASEREQITNLWQLLFRRLPTDMEVERAQQFLSLQQKTYEQQVKKQIAATTQHTAKFPPQPAFEFAAVRHSLQNESDNRFTAWKSAYGNFSAQTVASQNSPLLLQDTTADLSYLHFDGQKRFFTLQESLDLKEPFAIMTLIRDHDEKGYRQIFSNWNGKAGNSVTSFFLGLTGEGQIRISDDYTTTSILGKRHLWHILGVVCNDHDVRVFVDGKLVESLGRPLNNRNYAGPYVIGQQGNIDGEYFVGDLALLSLYQANIDDDTMQSIMEPWLDRLKLRQPAPQPNARHLALASLAQVLVSSNEFLYID